MKKLYAILFFCVLYFAGAFAVPHKFWILLKDKKNSRFSIQDPSAFLSQKAIDRRTRQHLVVNTDDIPVDSAYVAQIAQKGALVLHRSKWFNAVTVQCDSNTYNQILSLPFVKGGKRVKRLMGATGVSKFSLESASARSLLRVANDSGYYGEAYSQIHLLNGESLHKRSFRGEGMTIAVLDDGFFHADTLAAFDSLWANHQVLGTRDFVKPGNNVFKEDDHGMQVLSTMGGNKPGVLVGTAPKAQYWLVRTEDEPTENIIEESNWAAGAEFADSVGADIITTSLGYTTFDSFDGINPNPYDHTYSSMNGHTTLVSIAANKAASRGILVVAAAGNEGGTSWHYICAPGDADSVLTIGGVEPSGVHAVISSHGPSYDKRIKPDVCAQAVYCAMESNDGIGVVHNNGTSYAAPVTAGLAACLWQANPGATNMQILRAIQKCSSKSANPDSADLGYGIPDFNIAVVSQLETLNGPRRFVKIYPNPSSNNLYIDLVSDSVEDLQISIFDLTGRKVFSRNENIGIGHLIIPLSTALRPGIYLMQVSDRDRSILQKIVVR